MKYLKLFAVLFCACMFWGCDDSYYSARNNNIPMVSSEEMYKSCMNQLSNYRDRSITSFSYNWSKTTSASPYKEVANISFTMGPIISNNTEAYIKEQGQGYEVGIHELLWFTCYDNRRLKEAEDAKRYK